MPSLDPNASHELLAQPKAKTTSAGHLPYNFPLRRRNSSWGQGWGAENKSELSTSPS